MKVTIEDAGVRVSIENDVVFAVDVIDQVIVPALMGIGFAKETVIDAMEEVVDMETSKECDECPICDGCGYPEDVCQCD